MPWTYINALDEVDHELTADREVEGRYTFQKHLYFKPDVYESWVSGGLLNNIPYSAELIDHTSIPARGTFLPAPLDKFYLSHVVSITNLTEEEHGNAASYGVVTLEYENMPPKSSGSSSSNDIKNVPPWEERVADFSIIWQEGSEPMTVAYIEDEDMMGPIMTTAGQFIYDFTAPIWTGRATWTFNDRANSNYSMTEPRINENAVTLFNKFPIPAKNGLLLPPTYKRLFYTDEKGKTTEYAQWSFEIIINYRGFKIPVINAGTKAKEDGVVYDICSWYIYDPQNPGSAFTHFGSFEEMMEAKALIDETNKSITDETQKRIWSGDFIQSPVPLTEDGDVDYQALAGSTPFIKNYRNYAYGNWNLGIR